MSEEDTINNFNELVALFLAEAIRTRRTSLPRAAEICHRVVTSLPSLNSESQVLSMLTEIEKDFEEISLLKQAMHFGRHLSDIKVYEDEIKDYVSQIFPKDIMASNAFLQDAATPGITIQELCLKYPEFVNYLSTSSEKADVLAQIRKS